MRFAYLYFMKDDPDRIRDTVAKHVSHWQQQQLPGYPGRPAGGVLAQAVDPPLSSTQLRSGRDPWTLHPGTSGP